MILPPPPHRLYAVYTPCASVRLFLFLRQPSRRERKMEALEPHSQHSYPMKDHDQDQSSSITDSQSSDDEDWCPGDGICPPETQFQSCYQASLDSWSQAASSRDGAVKSLDMHLKAFLGLLENVPPFFHEPPKNIDLTGGTKSPLVLRSSLHIKTTDHPRCSQPWKPIDYLQCLGFPLPTVYKTNIEEPVHSVTLATRELRPAYLTSIVLAWSYVLSSRWVEILQSVGEDCALFHDSGDSMIENFWELITQGRWLARVKRGRAKSYSPWMLRGEDKSHNKRYLCQHSIRFDFAHAVHEQLRMGSVITKFICCFQCPLGFLHFRWPRKRDACWICLCLAASIAECTQPNIISTRDDFTASNPLWSKSYRIS